MYTKPHVKSQSTLFTDPEHVGQPPDGVDLDHRRSHSQAMFVQPILQYNVNDWSDVALKEMA